MTNILLIRHFATDWNEAGRLQGRVDRPLSPGGRAFASGKCLPDGWHHAPVLCSPLLRARETAALLGLEVMTEPRLTEMDMGAYEGAVIKDLRQTYGQAFLDNEARGFDYQPPEGESPRQVLDRVTPVLAALQQDSVLVCHKGVMRAILAAAWNWDMLGKPPVKIDFRAPVQVHIDTDGHPVASSGNLAWGTTA